MEDFSQYNADGTTLRKAQLRMVAILKEINKVCCKYNIPYWIDCGTLLGAKRHGGFIPWDDDLDISVLKEDYEKLRKALLEELPSQFVFTDWKTDKNIFDKCGRVRDKKSCSHYESFSFQKEQGLWVDIIIIEPIIPQYKHFVNKIYGPIFRQIHNYGKAIYKSKNKFIFNKCVAYVLYPVAYLLVVLGRLLARITNCETMMSTYSIMLEYQRPLITIFPLSEIIFEGEVYPCPKDVDGYLRSIYGDYMKLPETSKRLGHELQIVFYD